MKTAKKITVFDCKCERCGHPWTSRVEDPKQCPACRSPFWNSPRVKKIAVEKMAKSRA